LKGSTNIIAILTIEDFTFQTIFLVQMTAGTQGLDMKYIIPSRGNLAKSHRQVGVGRNQELCRLSAKHLQGFTLAQMRQPFLVAKATSLKLIPNHCPQCFTEMEDQQQNWWIQ
jgi:hypothetical protein